MVHDEPYLAVLSRRELIKQSAALAILALPFPLPGFPKNRTMRDSTNFDVIIVGGSYSGLAAGLTLGRSLKSVLIIDSGLPCNRQTPHSHNFLTQDGNMPKEIAMVAKQQVAAYDTIHFYNGVATHGAKTEKGFEIQTSAGESFKAKKLIFATGVRDLVPEVRGYGECWGISLLHCPYCHGYEVRGKKTAVIGNGEYGFEFASLISNWTSNLTLLTNGLSTLTQEQMALLKKHKIEVIEKEIARLEHKHGYLGTILFGDGSGFPLEVAYTRVPFEQNCTIPSNLGCELSEEGYIKVDAFQKTNVDGVFASGDSVTRLRTVANAVAMGTTAGMMANRELVFEQFN